MIALIDGDEIIYKVALSYQKKAYYIKKDDKVLWKAPYLDYAIESIENRDDLEIETRLEVYDSKGFEQKVGSFISSILFNTGSDSCQLCLSGTNNFRNQLATLLPYKGNRPAERPILYEAVRTELLHRGAEYVDHLEADDLLVVKYMENIGNSVICSTDKDLRTVPSLNYNIQKGKVTHIDVDEAKHNFYYQLLIGDSTDNIPSPFGLGKEGASKILEELRGKSEIHYISHIAPIYYGFLQRRKKSGEFKTEWYKEQSLYSILDEIGNLLYMRRTKDIDERWIMPIDEKTIEESINTETEELVSMEGQTA